MLFPNLLLLFTPLLLLIRFPLGFGTVKYFLLLMAVFSFSYLLPVVVDTDAYRYAELYNNIMINDFTPAYLSNNEIGYLGINILFASINAEAKVFFSLVTSFTLVFFIFSIKATNKEKSLFLLYMFIFGYFSWAQNGIRQSIAILFFFIAIFKMIEGKYSQYILIIFLGCLFHKSIILMLPIYFFRYLQFNKIYSLSVLFISMIFIYFDNVSSLINNVIGFLDISYLNLYDKSDILNVDKERLSSGIGVLVRLFTALFLISIIDTEYVNKCMRTKVLLFCFLIYHCLLNIFFGVEAVSRISMYFLPITLLLYSLFTVQLNKIYNKILWLFIISINVALYFVKHIF